MQKIQIFFKKWARIYVLTDYKNFLEISFSWQKYEKT